MKIAIPVMDDRATICPSFARTPEFLCIDTADDTQCYLKNPAADAEGGAGIQAAQVLLDQAVDAVLTPRLGENAGKVLLAGDVAIYKTTTADIDEELRKFHQATLEPLTQMHPGFHGHGFG